MNNEILGFIKSISANFWTSTHGGDIGYLDGCEMLMDKILYTL
jgi:hypothetical protein